MGALPDDIWSIVYAHLAAMKIQDAWRLFRLREQMRFERWTYVRAVIGWHGGGAHPLDGMYLEDDGYTCIYRSLRF